MKREEAEEEEDEEEEEECLGFDSTFRMAAWTKFYKYITLEVGESVIQITRQTVHSETPQ